MTITCAACGKPFTFDEALTQQSAYHQLSRGASSGVTYYPACPHCEKRHKVAVPDTERKK